VPDAFCPPDTVNNVTVAFVTDELAKTLTPSEMIIPPVLLANTVDTAVIFPFVLTADVAWMVTLAVGNTM
jgi:hypothetical protein